MRDFGRKLNSLKLKEENWLWKGQKALESGERKMSEQQIGKEKVKEKERMELM